MNPRSHAPRGNAVLDAPRPLGGQSLDPGPTTRSVGENIPTQSVGTRRQYLRCLQVITNSTVLDFAPEGRAGFTRTPAGITERFARFACKRHQLGVAATRPQQIEETGPTISSAASLRPS